MSFPSLPERGPGVWKLNTSLLQDETLAQEVREFWIYWQVEKPFFHHWRYDGMRVMPVLTNYFVSILGIRPVPVVIVFVHSRVTLLNYMYVKLAVITFRT